MDFSQPFRSLFPTVDSAVLAVLAGSTKPRTGREVARLAGRSQSATQRVLDRLVEHGLVTQAHAGRSRVYTLNRDHLAAEPVEDLANLRAIFFGRLKGFFRSWHPAPVHVSVFGSVARGEGNVDSDVDIFLVRPEKVDEDDPEWRSSVGALAEVVFEWSGNHAGIAEVSEADMDRLRHDQPAVVENLRADAVDIAGTPVRELLRRM